MKVILDCFWFQLGWLSGITRLWLSIMKEWSQTGFAQNVTVLDRGNAPRLSGFNYVKFPKFSYENSVLDRISLDNFCLEQKADVFLSTYYTFPSSINSIFFLYDMIPEVEKMDLTLPEWREKHLAINKASSFISISRHSARDLLNFFPNCNFKRIVIAYSNVDCLFFKRASDDVVNAFKSKYKLGRYFLIVGASITPYKNLAMVASAMNGVEDTFQLLATMNGKVLQGGISSLLASYNVLKKTKLVVLDHHEMPIAYSGAEALIYPSRYEGFGMPLIEAMACKCPIITTPFSCIPEIAGDTAIYVKNSIELREAILNIIKGENDKSLIDKGLERCKQFSVQFSAQNQAAIVSKELQRYCAKVKVI
jgi:glycosyltransferase involved in cell wall biosynthesis